MTYAHVTDDGTVDQFGNPPHVALVDGRWYDLRPRDPAVLAIAGWYIVEESPRPPDTATTTFDAVYTFDGDSVNLTWTERAKTADELTAATRTSNTDVLYDRTQVQAWLDAANTFLALPSPTNAQTLAQVQRNTRAIKRLAKIVVGQRWPELLDDITGL